ncbi:unnamed protein product, partial [Prorocentrum cordatum]
NGPHAPAVARGAAPEEAASRGGRRRGGRGEPAAGAAFGGLREFFVQKLRVDEVLTHDALLRRCRGEEAAGGPATAVAAAAARGAADDDSSSDDDGSGSERSALGGADLLSLRDLVGDDPSVLGAVAVPPAGDDPAPLRGVTTAGRAAFEETSRTAARGRFAPILTRSRGRFASQRFVRAVLGGPTRAVL